MGWASGEKKKKKKSFGRYKKKKQHTTLGCKQILRDMLTVFNYQQPGIGVA